MGGLLSLTKQQTLNGCTLTQTHTHTLVHTLTRVLPIRATTNAPSFWLNNPSTIALLAAGGGGSVVRQTSQCFSVTNELNSFEIYSVRTVHGPSVFVFLIFFLVSGYRCVLCPRVTILAAFLFSRLEEGFISLSPPHAAFFLDNVNSGGACTHVHTRSLPQASFLPDLVRGHVSALCSLSLKRPGRAINK